MLENIHSRLRVNHQSGDGFSEYKSSQINLGACWRLIRPVNLIITALSVFIAGVISSPNWLSQISLLILASFSAAMIAAGGNAFNDYCDRELDRHQKPHRPIPSGQIKPEAALRITAICFLFGFAVAIALGGMMVLIASWAIFLLLFYSWRWKRTPLLGNLSVAFVAALAFVYGGAAVQAVSVAVWAAGLAFFFHLGREIVKDMEDVSGDAAASAGTFAVRFGLSAAGCLSTLTFMFLIAFLPLPYLLGPFNNLYFYVVLAGILPVLIVAVVWPWRWRQPRQLHRLSTLLKVDMFVGLAALLVGSPTANSLFP